MSKTNNFPKTAEEFLSNPNSYEKLYIPPHNKKVIGKEEIEKIAKVLETNETVTLLSYYGRDSTEDKGSEAFGKTLESNKVIRHFEFSSNINNVNFQKLADGIGKNTSIESLVLSCPNIGDDGMKAIAMALNHNKTISSVWFDAPEFTDCQLLTITECLKNHEKINNFSISCKITMAGLQHIYNMLDNNPRIIDGELGFARIEEQENDLSFLHKRISCQKKLDENRQTLSHLYKLAKFVNDNLESFVGEFDVASNPKHPSALKFYQQSNKDLLSKMLKLVTPDVNPEKVLMQLNSYINYNLFSLTGVFKTPQPDICHCETTQVGRGNPRLLDCFVVRFPHSSQ
jgi:hypothetical protein